MISNSKRKRSPVSALPFKKPKLMTPRVLLTPKLVMPTRFLQQQGPQPLQVDKINTKRLVQSCPPVCSETKLRRPEIHLGLSGTKLDLKSFHVTDFGEEHACQAELERVVIESPAKDEFASL
mmetsp:Transcript_33281/g.58395  ORF Transcript_33281/g.58395 Transcript_33281/m.58395 type:complete len:122 (-) Transcript_33281:14-379(-)